MRFFLLILMSFDLRLSSREKNRKFFGFFLVLRRADVPQLKWQKFSEDMAYPLIK